MALSARWIVGFCVAAGLGGAPAQAQETEWRAGPYAYSDEKGGFLIRAISGQGTQADPVVITKELTAATPVTLVIRTREVLRPRVFEDHAIANGFIHLEIVALNNSGLPWVEFEFELQEHAGEPSTYGDGLSFDQIGRDDAAVFSDRYRAFMRDFEPADRLRFHDGVTDPLATARFRFLITDVTPISQFYLVLDPRIPTT